MTGKTPARIAVLGALASSALLLAVAAPPALAVDKPTEPGELTLIDSAQGKVLADKDGNPLYLRDADKPDLPDCTGECAANWPAAIGYPTKAAGVTGETAQTEANVDGTDQPQVIYETHPLYYFKNDKPNEPKGQEVEGWSLVGPDGKPVKARTGVGQSPSPDKSPGARKKAGADGPAGSDGYAGSDESAGAGLPPGSGGATPKPKRAGAGTGSDTGAMKATPSGAARGGAHHTVPTAAADEHPEAGPLALGSAAVAAGAGVLGFALLRRRRAEQRADATADTTKDGRS